MADIDDPAAAAARLEQALERIAALASRPIELAEPATSPQGLSAERTAQLADRLDALILRLRSALGVTTEQA